MLPDLTVGYGRVQRADSHPAELSAELIEIDDHANVGIVYVAIDRPAIGILATVAQDTAVRDEANPVEQLLRRVELAIDHARLSEIARRIVQPRTDPVGSDPHVHFAIVVALATREHGIVGARFKAQAGRHAAGIAAESDRLQLSTRWGAELNGGCEGAAIPSRRIVIRKGELRGRSVVAQRNAAIPVIRKQARTARELGKGLRGNQ